ncbi:hypothetical protein [Cellulomonas pakistanensis]|uniref:Uncharacterized protein n=1 Tax=Cellulomonas pakistanensis TaxID=992287 RepID=A0A919PE24_9CELL|nr:hypothetical protein [Cellulomonas pakistanensis]GIG36452.1 hypothetical protein Cpa01nite_18330 [Cellulomonas pakistanensis]
MSGLDIDRAAATQMAQKYRNAAEDLESALGGLPASVDGGIASGVLADIVSTLAQNAADLAVLSRVMGGVIDATVSDATATDDSVSESFGGLTLPGEEAAP